MVYYQQSNQRAFEILFSRWKNRVWSYVAKRVQSAELREEIVQKIFLKLHQKRDLYKNSYLFAQWIFTIAKTVTIDELRSQKKHKVNVELPAQEIAAEETPSIEIESNLSNLSSEQQEILKLKFEQDYTYDEISKLINKSEVNVRKIFSRAIEKLRQARISGVFL